MYDVFTEFAWAEDRWLRQENGRMNDIYEHPDKSKWFKKDCKFCSTAFSVEKVGKIWRCQKCGKET